MINQYSSRVVLILAGAVLAKMRSSYSRESSQSRKSLQKDRQYKHRKDTLQAERLWQVCNPICGYTTVSHSGLISSSCSTADFGDKYLY